jgi:hypothetical protein
MNARRLLDAVCAAVVVAAFWTLLANAQTTGTQSTVKSVRDEALRRELLRMMEDDQKARTEGMQELARAGMAIGSGADASDPKYVAIMKTMATKLEAVDGKNRGRLKEIVMRYGWPGISLVGKDGEQAAWLLVQHADADREFQKSCLQLMEALPDGEVHQQAIAYLTDRVLVGEKRPQRYGTQMDAEFRPRPLEDPANVDARRAKVGLPPLAEYIQMAREGYETLSKSPPETEETRVPTDATVSAVTGNHLQGGKHGNEHARFFRSLRGRPGASRAAVRLCATRRR